MLNSVLPILTKDVRECKAVHHHSAAALVRRNVDNHGLSLVRLGILSWVQVVAAAVHF